jgi:hypothetical protein
MRCVSLARAALLLSLAGCSALLGIDDAEPPGPVDGGDGCAAPSMTCGGECTRIDIDPSHCGRCDHGCGGGACLAGRCEPVTVAAGLDGPEYLAPTETTLYWTQSTGIASCPVATSCVPQMLGDGFDRVGELAVSGDRIFFLATRNESTELRYRIYQCPTTGCGDTPPRALDASEVDVGFSDLWAGPTRIYWRNEGFRVHSCPIASCQDNVGSWAESQFGDDVSSLVIGDGAVYVSTDGDLRTCVEPDGCATPATVAGTDAIGLPFRVHQGRAYWIGSTSGVTFLFSCPLTDCSAPMPMAQDQPGVKEVAVDDTGVYWLNDATGTVRHCPLTGCPADLDRTYVAKNRGKPEGLALGPGFVYWIEDNDIVRVARP